jgi:hypothetical protein
VKGSDLQLYKIILLNYDELEVFKVNSKEEVLNGLNNCMGVEEEKLNYFRNIIEKFFI